MGWLDGWMVGLPTRSAPRPGGLAKLLGVASGGVAFDIFDLGGSEVGGGKVTKYLKRCKRWGIGMGWDGMGWFLFFWLEGWREKLLLIPSFVFFGGSEANLQLYQSFFFQKLQEIQCRLKRVWNFVDTIKPSKAFVPDCQVRKRSYSAGITGCGVPTVLSGLIKESPVQRSHRGVEIERTGNDWWIGKVLITNYKVQIWHWWLVMIITGFFVPFLQVFQDPKKKLQEVLPGDASSLPEWLKTFAVTWPRYNEIRLVALILFG